MILWLNEKKQEVLRSYSYVESEKYRPDTYGRKRFIMQYLIAFSFPHIFRKRIAY